MTEYAKIDNHERTASYYKNNCCVATLDLQSDNLELHEDFTKEETEEIYEAMINEAESFMNEFDIKN